MNRAPHLLIRADASSTIGVGHVMRCLALAQAWQDTGGHVVLAAAELPPSLSTRLTKEGVRVEPIHAAVGSLADAAQTLSLAAEAGAAWLVVDGYRFDAEYLQHLRSGSRRLLVLDDMFHLPRYPVDLLLNQNLSADPARYAGRVDSATELLLGPDYSLLRREFRTTAVPAREAPRQPRRVLVSFGGGDRENFTGQILGNLSRSPRQEIEVMILAGAANPHLGALRHQATGAPFPVQIRVNVDNVAEAMTWADGAISAAGSTVWELAAMRLPALIGAFEDNQLAGLDALRALPIFRAWPVTELLTRDLGAELETLLAAPAATTAGFDTAGAVRVVDRLQTIASRPPFAYFSR
jgi:UDP-2,4-diacetamido-2,4,6-trideoxy-beta-L-altropyranose hydrolase